MSGRPPSLRPWAGREARRGGGRAVARFGLATVAMLVVPASPSPAQTPVRLTILDTAALLAPRLVESSGAAMSALVAGVVWTHNDSGDGPFLYATDAFGRDLGRVRVEGARNVDWEDLAAGPCVVVPGRCLYIGDIGDNGRRRDHIVVYRIREPRPPDSPRDTLRGVPVLDSLVLHYPDRRHNAEALAVTGDGTLLLITKELAGPPLLFRAGVGPGPAVRGLAAAGPLDMVTSLLSGRVVTGAALAPGDSLLAVRTYVSIHFFRLGRGASPVPLGPRSGITIPVIEPQGEGVCFDGPGRLILTSERGQARRGTIARLLIVPSQGPQGRPPH